MDIVKAFFAEVGEFLGNLWFTLKAFAASRKAVLTFVAVLIASGGQLLPQYAAALNEVGPKVEVLLTVLVAAIAFEDAFKKPVPPDGAG